MKQKNSVASACYAHWVSFKEYANLNTEFLLLAAAVLLFGMAAQAATTGTEFKDLYDMVYGAVSGYLGRGIALLATAVGAIVAAVKGNYMLAAGGVALAIIIVLAPKIVNALFASAII